MKTTNTGNTWEEINSGTYFQLNSIKFIDFTNGYVVGNSGLILYSSDAGSTWNKMRGSVATTFLYDLDFPDLNTGFICGGYGTILKTTNAGADWILQSFGWDAPTLWSINFPTELIGYIVGRKSQYGVVVKTTDGGNSWIVLLNDISSPLHSTVFLDGNIGYAVGHLGSPAVFPGVIIKTTDGGYNWNTIYTGSPNTSLNHIYSYDENIFHFDYYFSSSFI